MWVIEDELHSERLGEFETRDEAIGVLVELAKRPWDEAPNQAPCTAWRTCGRNYELVEFHTSESGNRRQVQVIPALTISAEAVHWLLELPRPA